MKQKFGLISLFIIALSLPIAGLFAKLAELYLKHTNAGSIDITAKSAYNQQIILVGFITLGILTTTGLVAAFVSAKKHEVMALARKSLVLAGIVVGLVLITSLVQTRITLIESSYSKKQVDSFLQTLAK